MFINWELVPFFSVSEFDDPKYPGSGDCIDGAFLHMIVRLRLYTGWPMITHAPVGGAVDVDGSYGHAVNSYHLKKMGCKALDFHFRTKASVREQVHVVLQTGFGGVGMYLNLWRWNNQVLPVAFHIDTRPIYRFQAWTCRERGNYVYLLQGV